MAEAIWLGATAHLRSQGVHAAVPVRVVPQDEFGADCEFGHREHDSLPSRPLWCSLITRQVRPSSAEGKSEKMKEAIRAEQENMAKYPVWDSETVMEYDDLIRDPQLREAFISRVFHDSGNEEQRARGRS